MTNDQMSWRGYSRRLHGSDVFFPPDDDSLVAMISYIANDKEADAIKHNYVCWCVPGQYLLVVEVKGNLVGFVFPSVQDAISYASEHHNAQWFYTIPDFFN